MIISRGSVPILTCILYHIFVDSSNKPVDGPVPFVGLSCMLVVFIHVR